MNISAEKNEIIKWINSLENPEIIEEINKISLRKSFDFEKEWQRGISGDEFKKKNQNKLQLTL
ncbi:hypothetical protein SAMN05421841_0383 [Chryseobacterium wanjuense]|uniref:Uncharacterized protein n=1 Tax=Chryseobacterium wanjuense TaxID=356305 RepID=A0A1I0N5E7_9FLAO|nr:hypothetical protein [Chryseobacterium wanjuense]SEV96111.1 hypothetical protein SAMN05421841_0383 [Chryseobacterium wanjuense]